jgi:hypothetical protein
MKPSVPLAVPLTVVLGPSGAQAQTAVKIGILSDMSSLSRRHGRTELRGGREDGGRRLRPREGYDGDLSQTHHSTSRDGGLAQLRKIGDRTRQRASRRSSPTQSTASHRANNVQLAQPLGRVIKESSYLGRLLSAARRDKMDR